MDDSFTEEGQRIQEMLFSSDDMDELDLPLCSEPGERNDDIMGVVENEDTTEDMILDEPFRTSSPLSGLTTSSLAMEICLQDLESIISATSFEPNSNVVLPEEENNSSSSTSQSSLSSSLFELDSDMYFFSMDESLQEQEQEQVLVLPFNLPIVLPRYFLTSEIIELLLMPDPFFILPDFDVEDNDAEVDSWLKLDDEE